MNFETKFLAYPFKIISYDATTIAIAMSVWHSKSIQWSQIKHHTIYLIIYNGPILRKDYSIQFSIKFNFDIFYNILLREGPGPLGPSLRSATGCMGEWMDGYVGGWICRRINDWRKNGWVNKWVGE